MSSEEIAREMSFMAYRLTKTNNSRRYTRVNADGKLTWQPQKTNFRANCTSRGLTVSVRISPKVADVKDTPGLENDG